MITPYSGTGASPTIADPWPPLTDATPALYEMIGEDPGEADSDTGDTPGMLGARTSPVIRGRPNELTRPAVDPWAEALFIAGYLPDDALPSIVPAEDVRYERANVVRVALLARKYVAKEFSPEEEARLDIATERVRRLLPRVTEKDFLTLTNELLRLDDIKKEHDRLRKDAGLGK